MLYANNTSRSNVPVNNASASSKINNLTPSHAIAPSSNNCRVRPGVPTTMCGCVANRARSSFTGSPPTTTATSIPRRASSASNAAINSTKHECVCNAHSRVGDSVNACARLELALILSNVITTNVIVFPVPLFACAMTSAPKRPSGVAAS